MQVPLDTVSRAHHNTNGEASRATGGEMDATIDPAVGNLNGSCTEGGEAAGLQNLIRVLAAYGECDVVCAKVPACASGCVKPLACTKLNRKTYAVGRSSQEPLAKKQQQQKYRGSNSGEAW